MKTVAEFKRLIKVGAQVHTIWHRAIIGRDDQGREIYGNQDRGVAKVTKKTTSQFAIGRLKSDGTLQDSYMSWPKATGCTFNGNSITIHEPNREGELVPILTYTIMRSDEKHSNPNGYCLDCMGLVATDNGRCVECNGTNVTIQ